MSVDRTRKVQGRSLGCLDQTHARPPRALPIPLQWLRGWEMLRARGGSLPRRVLGGRVLGGDSASPLQTPWPVLWKCTWTPTHGQARGL